jgi:hypothetical protein
VGRDRIRRIAVVLVAIAAGATGCGGSSPRAGGATRFEAQRRLGAADQRALDSVAGTAATVPLGLSDADLMGAMRTPWHGFADAATAARFRRQLARARAAAIHYASARSARRDGYVLASYFVPGFGVHWIDWSLVTKPFDPGHPAMLLYDGEGPDARLLGLSYYTATAGTTAPTGFAGTNDRWHRHFGDCYAGGFVVGENVGTLDACAKRCEARALGVIRAPVGTPQENDEIDRFLRGHPEPTRLQPFCRLVPGTNLWMLHAWVVAGRPNPDGLFSTMNATVTRCRTECRRSRSS